MRFGWFVLIVAVTAGGTGYFYRDDLARLAAFSPGLPKTAAALNAAPNQGTPAATAGRGSGGRGGPQRPDLPVPVTLATVRLQDVPLYLTGIGTVAANNTVQVRPRVDGQLMDVRFKEGQDVKAGDVLALIDPRQYQASLKQAQAALQKDQANLANVKRDLERFDQLSGNGYATRQSVDTQKALVAQLEAQAIADQAQIDIAKTQLDYTTITAPIDGRTGLRQVDVGNILRALDTVQIVTITQIQPIGVLFTLPADNLGKINRALADHPLPVEAYAKDNATKLADGSLLLVDNQIDQQTGTIKLKAVFPNTDRALWPGQFVNAHLLIETRRNAVTLPTAAIQRGPNGPYVWLVNPDKTVAMREIGLGVAQDGMTLVDRGLVGGETYVLEGQYRLQPGTKIEEIAPDRDRPATEAETPTAKPPGSLKSAEDQGGMRPHKRRTDGAPADRS